MPQEGSRLRLSWVCKATATRRYTFAKQDHSASPEGGGRGKTENSSPLGVILLAVLGGDASKTAVDMHCGMSPLHQEVLIDLSFGAEEANLQATLSGRCTGHHCLPLPGSTT
jgi:hypothetical protein